jgi:hypothetical protein
MKRLFALLFVVLTALTPAYGDDKPSPAEVTEARELIENPDVRPAFGRLRDYEVLGPATRKYNCIAHSIGVHDRWVNPMTGPADRPLCHMDELYAQYGYRRVDGLNMGLEKGVQKVIVYAHLHEDATIKEVTHASLQESDGSWSSKLGSLPLIRHATPDSLRGKAYGAPVAVYVRPRP